ncbi:Piso0_005154 [Millerozyma farinosa CBS 7064]|uniref:Piso0_005154 protein n=1 Tax=Pichia sorbitophila (strain ATCC MYA-4447 / BCRC 22081 / CBS 7064 / NBRC 10061 / NRRL Y-12695) TaxID=559304 RepID=G8Y4D0_PICSO|nr:Piso0_005154 [Millerozyma farinosa CBS 7064]
MRITNFISFFVFFTVTLAVPVARLITRVHTAKPVTVTNTYTTGTTTVTLPPVEIFISNGVTYTFTLSSEAARAPTTTTSVYNDASPTTSSQAISDTTAQPAQDSGSNQHAASSSDAGSTNVPQQSTASSTSLVQSTSQETSGESASTSSQVTTTSASTSSPVSSSTSSSQTSSVQSTSQENNAESASTSSQVTPTSASTSSPVSSSTSSSQTSLVQSTSQENNADSASTSSQVTPTSASTSSPVSSSASSSQTSSQSSAQSSGSGDIPAPTAIAYSPYTDSGYCKNSSSIRSDLNLIKSKGINKVRVYGTDCGLFDNTLPIAKDIGFKVNQGLWITSEGVDSIDDPLKELINYGQENGWDVFDFITVGNEAVNSGFTTVDDLISKIKSVKSQLEDAGYNGNVSTSEVPSTFISNPSLCQSSGVDFVGITPHAYFDPLISADEAGSFVVSKQSEVASACNMDVMITETGYPSKGDTNGKNVPSQENQKQAIKTIIEKTNQQVTILTTYNDFWKEPGPYGIEQYFGVIDLFS